MIRKLFLLYVIYSIIGFFLEEAVYLWHNGELKNNHFLLLWHCPMYGFGGLGIYLLTKDVPSLILIFLYSMIITLIIEYFTSYIMEKIFLIKWWDYQVLHIKGRICLINAINFGFLGLIVHFISPYFIDSFKMKNITFLCIFLFIIILIDILYSSIQTYKITHKIKVKENFFNKRIYQKVQNNIELFKCTVKLEKEDES